VIRRNEVLIFESSSLKAELARLKRDNKFLVQHTKDAIEGTHLLRAQVAARIIAHLFLCAHLRDSRSPRQ
jgi:hypothetical protein